MSVSDLLNSTGGRSFKFAAAGDDVTGTVVEATVVQKRNFDTGELETWSDGGPVQQIRVTLATSLRDPGDPDDDGHRNVYVKGWGDQLKELRRAVRAAGATDLEPGGTFSAVYVGDGELAAGKRGLPPKVYQYSYTAPPSATAGVLGGPQAPAAPAPAPAFTAEQAAAYAAYLAQQTPPPPPPPPPPAAPAFTAEQAAAYAAYLAQQT